MLILPDLIDQEIDDGILLESHLVRVAPRLVAAQKSPFL